MHIEQECGNSPLVSLEAIIPESSGKWDEYPESRACCTAECFSFSQSLGDVDAINIDCVLFHELEDETRVAHPAVGRRPFIGLIPALSEVTQNGWTWAV